MRTHQWICAVRDRSKTRGAARLILTMLASRADQEGYCFPGHQCLARDTGLSLRTIERVIKEIPRDELEIIEEGGSFKNAERRSTRYRILIGNRTVTNSTDPRQSVGSQSYIDHRQNDGSTTDKLSPDHRQDDGLTQHRTHHKHTKARIRASGDSSSASDPAIPETLRTPAFLKAWDEWQEYRRQIRKPLKPLSLQKQLKKLESLGPDRAIAEINQSITNGWLGLFEPKAVSGVNNPNPKSVNRFNPLNL